MKWTPFPECNTKLANNPPPAQAPFFPGKFYSDGANSVYCFKASWIERLSILFFGRIWLTLRLGKDIAPPMQLQGKKTIFEKLTKPESPLVAKSGCRICHGTGREGRFNGKDLPCRCLRPKDEVIAKGHKVN